MNELEIWKKQEADFGVSCRIIVDDKNLADAASDRDDFEFSETPLEHFEFDDITEEDFNESVNDIDRVDYAVAAACGLLTAALDILWLDKFSLEEVSSFGVDQINRFVIKAASLLGYKGNDPDQAVRTIESTARLYKNNRLQHLDDFGKHTSWVGLCFSILSQFTGCAIGADSEGKLKLGRKLDKEIIGATTPDKILNGILVWAFSMAGEMAEGRLSAEKGSGIPAPVASLLKDLAQLPVLSGSADRVKEIIAILHPSDAGTVLARMGRFDLSREMGIGAGLIKASVSVVLNECLVRGFYLIRRFLFEIRDKKPKNEAGLQKLDSRAFTPYNNRVITRMLTVSSGTFAAITTAKAAVAGVAGFAAGGWAGAAAGFAANINYGGLLSFAFACRADGAYLASDISSVYQDLVDWNSRRKEEEQKMFDGFSSFRLSAEQHRIIHSLELEKVLYDIRQTSNQKLLSRKQSWIADWTESIARKAGTGAEEYFIQDTDRIYDMINSAGERKELWVYLAVLELDSFIPYYQLSEDDKQSGRMANDLYIHDVFFRRQIAVSEQELKDIKRKMEQYAGMLTGSENETNASVAAAALLTGGVSLIPRLIAGSRGVSAKDTYGQAMAGLNTTVLKGAGSIANMLGQGNVTIFTSAIHVPSECAKILALSEIVLRDKYDNISMIDNIRRYIYEQIVSLEGERYELQTAPDAGKSLNKRRISRIDSNLKYFGRTYDELSAMMQ